MTSKKHLSPVALLYFIYKTLVEWLWVIFVSFASVLNVFKDLHISLPLVVAGFVVLIVAISVIRYMVFTYEITDKMVTINRGIFIKKHIHIPYHRIQTITQSQLFFLIPFHLETIYIETAGHEDGKAEAVLPMVPDTVRSEIETYRQGAQPGSNSEVHNISQNLETGDENTYRINNHDLNLFSLTSLGILPIIAILGAIYGKVQEAIPDKYINSAFNKIGHESLPIIIGGVVIVLVVGLIASYLMSVLKYYRFTLSENNGQLQTTQGLITKRSFSVKQQRIQAIVFKQNVIRQLFNLTTVQTIVASKAGKEEDESDITMVPVIKNDEAATMVNGFVSWVPNSMPQLNRLVHSSYWYYIRNAILISLIVIIPSIVFFRFWGAISLVLIPLAVWVGWYSAKNNGYYIGNKQLIISDGHLLTRSIYVVETKNIQSSAVRQSVWMAKKGLAHFKIHVRSKNNDKEIELRYISKKEADELFTWLA